MATTVLKKDERMINKGLQERRPWAQRYLGLIIFICATLVGITGTMIKVWATGNLALVSSEKALKVLEDRTELVHAVPHLAKEVRNHVDDFKDFRNEQRSYNANINSKIDSLLLRTGRQT